MYNINLQNTWGHKVKNETNTELFSPCFCIVKDSATLPRIPDTECCSNTEALGEVGGDAKDNEKEVEVTLLIKGVKGTARANIIEAEVAKKSEDDSKILGKAKRGFCLMLKSFLNPPLNPPNKAEGSGTCS
jgi:hypothetical protein